MCPRIQAGRPALLEKEPTGVLTYLKKGIDLPEESHRRILRAYLAQGGDARVGSYRDFMTRLCIEMAEKL